MIAAVDTITREAIEAVLSDSLSARGIEEWWNARSRYLGGRRPVDVLEADPAAVRAAAVALVEGAYL